MRIAWVIGFWGTIVLTNCGLLAQERFKENAAGKVEEREVVDQKGAPEPGGTVTRGLTSAPSGNPAGRWRYKFHNGHWWYYGRGNQWLYWSGTAWTPYRRQTYAQWFNGRFGDDRSDAGDANRVGDRRRPASTTQREENEPQEGFGLEGRRPPRTVQRQKNEPQGGSFVSEGRRPPRTVQRQKNEPRGGGFVSEGRRPPLTVQRQKNSPRGDED